MSIINTRKHFFESFGLLSSFSWNLRAVALPVALKTTGYTLCGESFVFGELWVGASDTCNAVRAINTRIWWDTDQCSRMFLLRFPSASQTG